MSALGRELLAHDHLLYARAVLAARDAGGRYHQGVSVIALRLVARR